MPDLKKRDHSLGPVLLLKLISFTFIKSVGVLTNGRGVPTGCSLRKGQLWPFQDYAFSLVVSV